MKFILGKKIGMTQIWRNDNVIAVTKVNAGPCTVVQVKNKEKDGYNSVQIGFGEKKEKNIKKPQIGHLKDLKIRPRYLREFRIDNNININRGDIVNVGTFEIGDKVKVTSTSKGRGFQGVVKRYNFAGQTATHGTKDQERMPGSAGAMGAARIFKGKRMPGRMGGKQITVTGLEIIDVDIENNVLLIKGAISGPNGGFVLIKGDGELKIEKNIEVKENIEKEEKIKEEKEIEENINEKDKNEDRKGEIVEEKKKNSNGAEVKKEEVIENKAEKTIKDDLKNKNVISIKDRDINEKE